jgi:hypothetical protein
MKRNVYAAHSVVTADRKDLEKWLTADPSRWPEAYTHSYA